MSNHKDNVLPFGMKVGLGRGKWNDWPPPVNRLMTIDCSPRTIEQAEADIRKRDKFATLAKAYGAGDTKQAEARLLRGRRPTIVTVFEDADSIDQRVMYSLRCKRLPRPITKRVTDDIHGSAWAAWVVMGQPRTSPFYWAEFSTKRALYRAWVLWHRQECV